MDKKLIERVIEKAVELLRQDNTIGSRTLLTHATKLIDEYNDNAAQELDSCNKTSDS